MDKALGGAGGAERLTAAAGKTITKGGTGVVGVAGVPGAEGSRVRAGVGGKGGVADGARTDALPVRPAR